VFVPIRLPCSGFPETFHSASAALPEDKSELWTEGLSPDVAKLKKEIKYYLSFGNAALKNLLPMSIILT
jgi:hypothetical protein